MAGIIKPRIPTTKAGMQRPQSPYDQGRFAGQSPGNINGGQGIGGGRIQDAHHSPIARNDQVQNPMTPRQTQQNRGRMQGGAGGGTQGVSQQPARAQNPQGTWTGGSQPSSINEYRSQNMPYLAGQGAWTQSGISNDPPQWLDQASQSPMDKVRGQREGFGGVQGSSFAQDLARAERMAGGLNQGLVGAMPQGMDRLGQRESVEDRLGVNNPGSPPKDPGQQIVESLLGVADRVKEHHQDGYGTTSSALTADTGGSQPQQEDGSSGSNSEPPHRKDGKQNGYSVVAQNGMLGEETSDPNQIAQGLGEDPEFISWLREKGWHFYSRDGEIWFSSPDNGDGDRGDFADEVGRLRSEWNLTDKTDSAIEGLDEKGQKAVDDFLARVEGIEKPSLDNEQFEDMMSKQARQRAAEQALQMRSQLEMGAGARLSPDAMQSRQSEMATRFGMENSRQDAQARFQQQLANFEAEKAHNQQKLAAAMQVLQTSTNLAERQAAMQVASATQAAQMQLQYEMIDAQRQAAMMGLLGGGVGGLMGLGARALFPGA